MGERLWAEFRISEPHRVSPCSCPGHGGRLGFLLFSVGRQRAGCVFSKAVPDVDAWRVCLGRGGGVAGTGCCRLLPGLPGPPPGAQEVNEPSCITVAFCSYQEVWRQGGGHTDVQVAYRRRGNSPRPGRMPCFHLGQNLFVHFASLRWENVERLPLRVSPWQRAHVMTPFYAFPNSSSPPEPTVTMHSRVKSQSLETLRFWKRSESVIPCGCGWGSRFAPGHSSSVI